VAFAVQHVNAVVVHGSVPKSETLESQTELEPSTFLRNTRQFYESFAKKNGRARWAAWWFEGRLPNRS
jgi:hypothetical protein